MKISSFKFLYSLAGLTFFYFPLKCNCQAPDVSIFWGITNYLGELTHLPFTANNAGQVLGISFKYPVNDHYWLRVSVAKGNVSGDDKYNSSDLQRRNLSFQSGVTDGYLAVEYRFFSEERSVITPYLFAGAGIFNFNPYVHFGDKNEKVYLQPLGTEGQGLPEYPERKMYTLTNGIIPFGTGLLWRMNEKWMLGLELRMTYTFTDYLDDVSNRYALPEPLLRDRGPLAVELAWRRDEYDGSPYTNSERRRGNPDNNDWYYFVGLQAAFRINTGSDNASFKKGKSQLGCPKW